MEYTFGEINIICSDLQKSLHFYRDILGFAPQQDDEGFYHLHLGSNQFLLLPIASESQMVAPYGTVAQFSMDLLVDDLKGAYAYFQEHGVSFARHWEVGRNMFVIRDPDGLHWEVIQS